MLKLDTVRGPHSTGLARVGRQQYKHVETVKSVGTPYDLIEKKGLEYYKSHNGRDILGLYSAMMGHNRWATVGDVNEANAHPFTAKHITGAHNGTLEWWSRDMLDPNRKFDTDSEALFNSIADNGIDETMKKLCGAWALTWYDANQDTFNILRNKERPLVFAEVETRDAILYASEEWMIRVACAKHDVAIHDDKVFSFPTDYMVSWKLGDVQAFKASNYTVEEKEAKAEKPITPLQSFSSNVVVWNNNKQSLTQLTKLVGTSIDFFVGKFVKDEQGKEYLEAWQKGTGEDIRLYNPDLALLGDSSVMYFSGLVRKAKKTKHATYLLLHMDTISPAKYYSTFTTDTDWEDKDNSGSEIKGYNGEVLTRAEWYLKTGNGCTWCGESWLPLADHAKMHWTGPETYLCAECVERDEVKAYLAA